jgi:two-component system, NtrC family, nitrogen regulation sensor histidine kinase NtrY
MRLAPSLVLAFGFVATLSVAGLGLVVREDQRTTETQRFEQEVHRACDRVVAEIGRQAESDRKLVAGACQAGELVDRALIWLEAGSLDDERRLALSRLVPEERQAFDLDELLLATAQGERLGQDPLTLLNLPRSEIAALVGGDVSRFGLRSAPAPALIARCRKPGAGGVAVGLVGVRNLVPVIERLGKTIDVRVTLGDPPAPAADVAQATCTLNAGADSGADSGAGAGAAAKMQVSVSKSKAELAASLARIDRTTIYAALASSGLALLLAVLLARSLGGPIAELAAEARKVASGEARPLRVRGSGEIAELAQAFDTMLVDLEATRRRLAATSRVAAWREVARRVAHEIKNPLAPIRAAVETLRRLRARQDPEFDAYFDQATRTVLGEVSRIANIVTEFTSFARLAPPRPEALDLVEVARQVTQMHQGGAASVALEVEGSPPPVRADRDQIVQVLTNLVQNALDAVADRGPSGRVKVTVGTFEPGRTAAPAHVHVTVSDNGAGLASEIASRLFEPYATSKPTGTGLGLAIAQRIAIEHDGELSHLPREGAAGQGTHAASEARGASGASGPSGPSGASGPGAAQGAAERWEGGGAVFRLVLPVRGPPPASTPPSGRSGSA